MPAHPARRVRSRRRAIPWGLHEGATPSCRPPAVGAARGHLTLSAPLYVVGCRDSSPTSPRASISDAPLKAGSLRGSAASRPWRSDADGDAMMAVFCLAFVVLADRASAAPLWPRLHQTGVSRERHARVGWLPARGHVHRPCFLRSQEFERAPARRQTYDRYRPALAAVRQRTRRLPRLTHG